MAQSITSVEQQMLARYPNVKTVEQLSQALCPEAPISSICVEHASKPAKKIFSKQVLAVRIHEGIARIAIYYSGQWKSVLIGKMPKKTSHSFFLTAGCQPGLGCT